MNNEMTNVEMEKFLNSLNHNPQFRNDTWNALTHDLYNNESVWEKIKPSWTEKEENDVIDEVLENFDFEIVLKVTKILPVLRDDFVYLKNMSVYENEHNLSDCAESLLREAFDGLKTSPEYIKSNDGVVIENLHYYVGGIFDVDVFWDIETKKLDAKLSWPLEYGMTY